MQGVCVYNVHKSKVQQCNDSFFFTSFKCRQELAAVAFVSYVRCEKREGGVEHFTYKQFTIESEITAGKFRFFSPRSHFLFVIASFLPTADTILYMKRVSQSKRSERWFQRGSES